MRPQRFEYTNPYNGSANVQHGADSWFSGASKVNRQANNQYLLQDPGKDLFQEAAGAACCAETVHYVTLILFGLCIATLTGNDIVFRTTFLTLPAADYPVHVRVCAVRFVTEASRDLKCKLSHNVI